MLKREYHGNDFSVQIEPVFREVVSVTHVRGGQRVKLDGVLIGMKWEGIDVELPPNVDEAQVTRIVRELEEAFAALGVGYVITRRVGVDKVPEPERKAALSELSDMGYEIEIQPDGKTRLMRRPDAPRQDVESQRTQVPRVMTLIQALHGTRHRVETLAKSKEF